MSHFNAADWVVILACLAGITGVPALANAPQNG